MFKFSGTMVVFLGGSISPLGTKIQSCWDGNPIFCESDIRGCGERSYLHFYLLTSGSCILALVETTPYIGFWFKAYTASCKMESHPFRVLCSKWWCNWVFRKLFHFSVRPVTSGWQGTDSSWHWINTRFPAVFIFLLQLAHSCLSNLLPTMIWCAALAKPFLWVLESPRSGCLDSILWKPSTYNVFLLQ